MGRRLFLALPVPKATREALAAFAARLGASGDGWRWVDPEGYHVTLRFYGTTPPEREPALQAALGELAARHPRFALRVRGCGAFPSPWKPRLFWAGLEPDTPTAGDPLAALAALAADAEGQARALGFEPEERFFRPHLTLARAKGGDGRGDGPVARTRTTRGRSGTARYPGALRGDVEPEFGSLPADRLVIYESHLGPSGARYERWAEADLAGSC